MPSSKEKKPLKKERRTKKSPASVTAPTNSKLSHVLLFLSFLIIALLAFKVWSLSEEKKVLIPAHETLTTGVTEDHFTYNGRTLIVHDTPPVETTLYTKSNCATCDKDITSLTQKITHALPTAQITVKELGEEELQELSIPYIPFLSFDATVTETSFYTEGESFFTQHGDDTYHLDTGALGYTPQAYITTPVGTESFPQPEKESTATQETTQATPPVEIHAFLSTDCAQCATMHDVLSLIETRNTDIAVVYHFASTRETTEHGATTALACATSLGKGDAYQAHLFARQSLWSAATDKDAAFLSYATAWGIPSADFTTCLKESSTEEAVATQNALFARYGINTVPTLFIGESPTPLTGVQTVATIEKALAAEKK